MSKPTSNVSIKGNSSNLITEFFDFSINSILYQRGIYPPEDFKMVKKYGLNLLVINDPEIKNYIRKIMVQLNKWLQKNSISRLILAVINKSTTETVERWQFNIELVSDGDARNDNNNEKTNELIQKEIQAIIRQITASVTFLPMLETDDYTFNVLVYYNDVGSNVPHEWIDSDSKEIVDGELVNFKSFATNDHKIETLVSYKVSD